ncbi:MAG TPA: efflux RND transporter periplasmic adaptor subunit [Chitinispirillaceae bacterium]|nr:efflux RND transporter periplasmic adaptor subunit [Chitinispirillaceae bacterium]
MDKIRKKRPFYKKHLISLIILAAITVSGLYKFFIRDTRAGLKVDVSKIVISTVSLSEFREYIPVQGKVLPVKTVYLDAVEGGHVEQKYLEAGAWVDRGDTILRLSNTSLILNMMQREAEYMNLQDEVANARVELEVMTGNYKNRVAELEYQSRDGYRQYYHDSILNVRKAITMEEYQKSRERFHFLAEQRQLLEEQSHREMALREDKIKTSDKFLRRMEKNLELINEKIQALTIRAPVKGQIRSLDVEVGESKTAGQRLGQINIMDDLKIVADIDEHYIRRINNGNRGEFALDKNTYGVMIQKILPDVEKGRFQVELRFDGGVPSGIMVGQTVHIKLQVGAGSKKDALVLSRGGFYQSTAGQWVYVISNDSRFAEKRQVTIGKQNTDVFEILSGLEAGEKVITSGYDGFNEKEILILKY